MTKHRFIPDSCVGCTFLTNTGEYGRCKKHDYYISLLYGYSQDNFRGTRRLCPDKVVDIKDSWLWLQLYRKGLEKEEIPIGDSDSNGTVKDKVLVRASWLIMKIAYVADWSIKKYDERMAKRRLLYNVKQAVNHYIQS